MNIIETKGLTKTFKRYKKQEGLRGSIRGLWKREYEEKTAVHNIDLQVQSGEFVGLIGPNGAGKTTTMKMLTGIISPTSGEIQVLGYVPNELKNSFKKQYAIVMGQKSQLFFELTANDTLRLFKEIYEISEQEYQENKSFFADLFDIRELMDVPVRTLSLGERMKLELMAALLHNPKLLFLDEPTIGLDAIASKQIRGFLKEINKEKGTTILLTSHYMEDIRALCDRSIVINHGCKIYDGATDYLLESYQRNKKITAIFDNDIKFHFGEIDITWIENSPHKKILLCPKESISDVIQRMMRESPLDISVEEEEIGVVIERIYQKGSGINA